MASTIRSRRNPPGTRTRTFKAGAGNLQRIVMQSISGTLLENPGNSGSGNSNPTPGSREVSIEVNRTEGVAPAGFYFVARASGFVEPAGTGPLSNELAHYTDLRYKWDFDEEGKVYDRLDGGEHFIWDRVFDIGGITVKWNKPGHPTDDPDYSGSAITFLGIDKNKAFGPHTGIVFAPTAAEFAEMGTGYVDKTIRVEVLSKAMVNAGEPPVVQTVTVRVHDPEVFFGDANTAYISPSSNFPSGASNTYTSMNAALAAHRSNVETRYLFNRNEVHNVNTPNTGWNSPNNYNETQFGAYGSGVADPVIVVTGTAGPSSYLSPRAARTALSHACTWGLTFKGNYDPAAPWTAPDSWNENGYNVGAYANYTTVWDCHFEGFAMPLEGTKDMRNQIVGNVSIKNWWNYGFYSNIGIAKCNWSGMSIRQAWDAIITDQSGAKHAYYYDVHGPFRVSHTGKLGEYIGYASHNACILQSNGGWGGGHQPSIRLGGNGNVDEPMLMRTCQDRVLALMGGTLGNGTFKGGLFPAMQVFDKVVNLLFDSTGDGAVNSFGCSGSVVRNTVSIIANTPFITKAHGALYRTRIPSADEPQDPSLFDYPIKIINTIGVDLRNDAIFGATSNSPSFIPEYLSDPCYSEWISTDNIIHTPNRGAGTSDHDTSNMPLSAVELGIGLEYPGRRFDANPPRKDTTAALTPRNISVDKAFATDQRVVLHVPEPGSPAYQTGDPVNGAIDDLFGNIRPVMKPSKGPIEPSS